MDEQGQASRAGVRQVAGCRHQRFTAHTWRTDMFVAPGTAPPDFAQKLSREGAERVAQNWPLLLINGLLLIVAGFLIFKIDWSVRSRATFIGALFIFEGISMARTVGIDSRVRRANVLS